jgi:hypothetical protein
VDGNQPVSRPLPTHYKQTLMFVVEFEEAITVFVHAKTVLYVPLSVTVGNTSYPPQRLHV